MNKINLEESALDLIEKPCFTERYVNSPSAANFLNSCCCCLSELRSSGFHSITDTTVASNGGQMCTQHLVWVTHSLSSLFFFSEKDRNSVLNYSQTCIHFLSAIEN